MRRFVPRLRGGQPRGRQRPLRPRPRIAADLGLTPGQLAPAWLPHQHEHVVPIPGSRTPAHIAENLTAARVELHTDTLARVDEALGAFRPEGTRATGLRPQESRPAGACPAPARGGRAERRPGSQGRRSGRSSGPGRRVPVPAARRRRRARQRGPVDQGQWSP
ncbi:aldo/keto reductase [Streptomyces sp. NPDC001070]